MKQINLFYIFILLISLTSCNKRLKDKKEEKKAIKTIINGGIVTSFEIHNEDESFEKTLKLRLDFLKIKESFEYNLIKEKNKYTITLPFILSKNKINSLLFSQGELFIKKDDSIYFNSNSFKKNELKSKKVPYNRFNLKFKEENVYKFKKFTDENLNQNIQIYIDTMLIIAPKIKGVISDGKLSISSLESNNFNSDILYAIFNYQYENVKFKKIEQKLVLEDNGELVEIPQKYHNLYNLLWNFLSSKGLTIIKNNTNFESKEELETSINIGIIRRSDFYGFLVDSNIESISDLNETFFDFQEYLNKYNYQSLNRKIDSLKQ
ncbi:hypothetical protein VBY74_11075 [Tenacibaculum ascidiaceicola]|uniref:hypothetical protein n=1 Tax=Tenacibaculum ascidiaceicola TaxID=1699411 RepID=UPI0039EAC2A3